MWLANWSVFYKTILAALINFTALVFFVRLAGKRVLSKLNIYDFIITISLGSTLASSILSNTVSITQGILALFCLVLLQSLISYITTRFKRIRTWVKSEPTLLFFNGEFIKEAMQKVRISEEEILGEIRVFGISDLEDVKAVILETNGMLSVLPVKSKQTLTALYSAKIAYLDQVK
ncbi:DUF421 domain-containing protein [Legionella sp. CNM-1927-20]|uniref:DUF421 domain-containing protein n=1 Tax=Legionella sp. CNM-1927-20 TaxID=3422221 RepID=UPI00403AC365